jgi:hypothetical protein
LKESKFSANVDSNPHGTHPLTLIATRFCSFRRQHGLACVESGRNLTKLWGDQKVNNGAVNPMCDREGAKPPPAIAVALTNSFLYSIKKQSLARLERHESLKSRCARVRFHYWRKFSRADFPPTGTNEIEVMLCSQLRTAGDAALDFRPQQLGLAKEPRRLA